MKLVVACLVVAVGLTGCGGGEDRSSEVSVPTTTLAPTTTTLAPTTTDVSSVTSTSASPTTTTAAPTTTTAAPTTTTAAPTTTTAAPTTTTAAPTTTTAAPATPSGCVIQAEIDSYYWSLELFFSVTVLWNGEPTPQQLSNGQFSYNASLYSFWPLYRPTEYFSGTRSYTQPNGDPTIVWLQSPLPYEEQRADQTWSVNVTLDSGQTCSKNFEFDLCTEAWADAYCTEE